MAYGTTHATIPNICFLKLPILLPIAKIAITPMQLHSAQKKITQITNIIIVFHPFF